MAPPGPPLLPGFLPSSNADVFHHLCHSFELNGPSGRPHRSGARRRQCFFFIVRDMVGLFGFTILYRVVHYESVKAEN